MSIEGMRASQLFNTIQLGTVSTLPSFATQFLNTRTGVGYEVAEATDESIDYNLYVKLDAKKTACLKLRENRQTQKATVINKSLVTWALNWSRLTKPRR